MQFLKWVIEVNEILEQCGYDCLFNEDEIEVMEQGECVFRTDFQVKAEWVFHKGFSAQQFVRTYAC